MGIQVYQETYTEEDYTKYQVRIRDQLNVLADLVRTPGFGGDIYSFGAELEIYVIDDSGRVKPINKELLIQAGDARVSLELNKFNLEYNLSPVSSYGTPFSQMHSEIDELEEIIQESAKQLDACVVPIGILPTLKREDITHENMTELSRFKALSQGLQNLRGSAFRVHINGDDPLNFNCNDITLEGANSSFQFHIRTPLNRFANTWNAVQLVTPLVLGISSNSPTLFGHRLWPETRIALFKQSVDDRRRGNKAWRKPARVNFGQGWLRNGPWELFSENVALFDPVLPVVYPKEAGDALRAGEVPTLDELRLHQSTIWSWNRAIYDPSLNGHFRIECRALPAGPSTQDMVANAAFMTGLTLGLRDQMSYLLPAFPFMLAEHNFYRAAQQGMDADILWPEVNGVGPREVKLIDLVKELMPAAERGLQMLDLDSSEITRYLDIIQRRIDNQMTGARWQIETLTHYFKSCELDVALERMLKDYLLELHHGRSIVDWERPR